jgi:hypothetical protein
MVSEQARAGVGPMNATQADTGAPCAYLGKDRKILDICVFIQYNLM